MTINEKTKAYIKVLADNIDFYEPSQHVIFYLWEAMEPDLMEGKERFKQIMRKNVEMLKILDIDKTLDEEFPDVDPEPMFFLDLNNTKHCFEVLEYKIIKVDAERQLQEMMVKLQEQMYKELENLAIDKGDL